MLKGPLSLLTMLYQKKQPNTATLENTIYGVGPAKF